MSSTLYGADYGKVAGQLPETVARHPVLDRLAPDLRQKVVLELEAMARAKRAPQGRTSVDQAASRYFASPHVQLSAVSPAVPPPENHSHATAQTSFPSDACIQTDFDGTPLRSYVPALATQTSSPPPTGAGLHSYIENHPLIQTTPDGFGVPSAASPLPAALSPAEERELKSEARTRFVLDRMTAEGERKKGQTRVLTPEYQEASRLGFPVPEDFEGQTTYLPNGTYDVSFGDHIEGGESGEGTADLKRRVHQEFWREFNLAFDRNITAQRDPEVDSLLEGVSRYEVGLTASPPYGGRGGYGGSVGSAGSDPVSPSQHRSAARVEAQNIFWQEYTDSLDHLLPTMGEPRPSRKPSSRPSRTRSLDSYDL